MRLFLAIPLSREMKRQAEDIQEDFCRQRVRGNYSPEENLHITLAFIGEYDDPDRVLECLESVSFQPFAITADRVGSFGSLWWMGFQPSAELERLVKQIRRALAEGEIPFDRKRFQAHVTLLRRPECPDGQVAFPEPEPVTMTVRHFSLMQSTRGKNGMIYTELGFVRARENPQI